MSHFINKMVYQSGKYGKAKATSSHRESKGSSVYQSGKYGDAKAARNHKDYQGDPVYQSGKYGKAKPTSQHKSSSNKSQEEDIKNSNEDIIKTKAKTVQPLSKQSSGLPERVSTTEMYKQTYRTTGYAIETQEVEVDSDGWTTGRGSVRIRSTGPYSIESETEGYPIYSTNTKVTQNINQAKDNPRRIAREKAIKEASETKGSFFNPFPEIGKVGKGLEIESRSTSIREQIKDVGVGTAAGLIYGTVREGVKKGGKKILKKVAKRSIPVVGQALTIAEVGIGTAAIAPRILSKAVSSKNSVEFGYNIAPDVRSGVGFALGSTTASGVIGKAKTIKQDKLFERAKAKTLKSSTDAKLKFDPEKTLIISPVAKEINIKTGKVEIKTLKSFKKPNGYDVYKKNIFEPRTDRQLTLTNPDKINIPKSLISNVAKKSRVIKDTYKYNNKVREVGQPVYDPVKLENTGYKPKYHQQLADNARLTKTQNTLLKQEYYMSDTYYRSMDGAMTSGIIKAPRVNTYPQGRFSDSMFKFALKDPNMMTSGFKIKPTQQLKIGDFKPRRLEYYNTFINQVSGYKGNYNNPHMMTSGIKYDSMVIQKEKVLPGLFKNKKAQAYLSQSRNPEIVNAIKKNKYYKENYRFGTLKVKPTKSNFNIDYKPEVKVKSFETNKPKLILSNNLKVTNDTRISNKIDTNIEIKLLSNTKSNIKNINSQKNKIQNKNLFNVDAKIDDAILNKQRNKIGNAQKRKQITFNSPRLVNDLTTKQPSYPLKPIKPFKPTKSDKSRILEDPIYPRILNFDFPKKRTSSFNTATPKKKRKQKTFYTPTLHAAFGNIKGKSKKGILSGLEQRPIGN